MINEEHSAAFREELPKECDRCKFIGTWRKFGPMTSTGRQWFSCDMCGHLIYLIPEEVA